MVRRCIPSRSPVFGAVPHQRFGRLRTVLKKLFAPGLEKALVFLDERLLGTTSNAVERGNRRYRKMQRTLYRVRTQRAIEGRLGLDLPADRRDAGPRRPRPFTRRRRHDRDDPVSLLQCRKIRENPHDIAVILSLHFSEKSVVHRLSNPGKQTKTARSEERTEDNFTPNMG